MVLQFAQYQRSAVCHKESFSITMTEEGVIDISQVGVSTWASKVC